MNIINMKILVDLFNDNDFEPEYLLLELTNGETVSGIIINERINMKSGTDGKYIYDIRHQDNDSSIPVTIEPFVGVNRYCSIALDTSLNFSSDNFIEIADWDINTND